MNRYRTGNTKTGPKSKRVLFIVSAILLLAAVGCVAFYITNRSSDEKRVRTVNYTPPTKEEKQAGDEQKEENVERKETDNKPTAPSAKATIVVTDASYYESDGILEARAYLTNVYEDGGTCTVTITKGSFKLSAEGKAFKDATTTQCGTMTIPRSQIPEAGNWQVIISYSSNTATGETSPKTVNVK